MSGDLGDRLSYLASLEDGWHDEAGGKQVTSSAIITAGLFVSPKTRLYPTLDGGISVEWDDQWGNPQSVEIEPSGMIRIWECEPDG